MPKRVQSELNGRVFDASDFRWALLTLLRERILTDAEMAASPAQTQEQEDLAAWARTEEGWVPVGVLEHQEQLQTNHEIALDECHRLAGTYFMEHWDERERTYAALPEFPVWWSQPGSPNAEPSGLVGVVRFLAGEDWGMRRGVIARRGGDVVVIDEEGAVLRPDEVSPLSPHENHPLVTAAKAAG
ncbi:hypothetical protein [Myxococcus xanthus]|uniref:Uncharacterized protein n=1 Tax=Myxococcus xanthus TaxID=34 RepID=A0A7Y4IHJ3_MYXXA|nr:hypothetical protein [Myxococcus xanthus]NOJ79206.1 hypothetical protein [Myxococcus xanthus]NOJ86578.1 hypothetical protein [Myxococcus xanthus]